MGHWQHFPHEGTPESVCKGPWVSVIFDQGFFDRALWTLTMAPYHKFDGFEDRFKRIADSLPAGSYGVSAQTSPTLS